MESQQESINNIIHSTLEQQTSRIIEKQNEGGA
jgi:hypothetical protein